MVSANITETSTALVFKMPLRVGAIDPSDTDWLQSPIGGNNVINTAMVMACVDVTVSSAATATVLDFEDENTPTGITDHVNPTAIIAVLSVVNKTDSAAGDIPNVGFTDKTLKFDSDTGGDGDVHRITFIYR